MFFQIASITFLFAFVSLKLSLYLFPKLGLLDRPDKYGLQRSSIPYPGGIVLFFVFVILTFIFVSVDLRLLGVLGAATLLVAISFFDDRYDLSPILRLVVQILCVAILIISGVGIEGIAHPFGGFIELNQFSNNFNIFGFPFEVVWLADLVVLAWILVIINTMNWLDGFPGLTSGVSTIGFTVLFLLSIRSGHLIDQTQVAHLSLILAVLSFTFWLFDFSPAKILLGDSGSMFFGFMLGVLSIFAGAKLATTFLILGFPILDVVWVITRRVFVEKRSPLRGDLRHFHHRLIKAGLSQRQSLVFIYTICALFGSIALFLQSLTKLVAIGVLVFSMVGLGIWVVSKEHRYQ